MGTVDKRSSPVPNRIIPLAEQRRLRVKRILSLYDAGYSMNEIVRAVKCSKSTVVRAVRARRKGHKDKNNR